MGNKLATVTLNLNFTLTAFFFLMLSQNCAPEYNPPTAKKPASSQIADASKAKASAESVDELKKEFYLLQTINDKLCKKVQKQRSECAGAVTLLPETSREILNCVSGVQAGAALVDSFEIDFTSSKNAGFKVAIMANEGQFTTDAVIGLKQKVKWKTVRSIAVKSPKVYDLLEMRLMPEGDGKLNISDISTFNFKVNDQVVLSKEDLRNPTLQGANYLTFDMKKITSMQGSEKCKVSSDVLNEIASSTQEEVKGVEEETLAAIGATMEEVKPKVDRERGRRQQFQSYLTGIENFGCWASVKMEKFEILIDGVHLEETARGRGNNQMQNRGNSTQFDFVFGESMKVTNADERVMGLFKPGGKLITEDFKDFEMSQLRRLQVTRGGDSFRSVQVSKPGVFGIGGWSGFDNYEVNRVSLASLKIKINNELAYERSAIGFVFEEGRNTWQDKNLSKNTAFVKLMQRNDCPTTGSTTTNPDPAASASTSSTPQAGTKLTEE